jgi:hypothetical protein
MEMLEMEEAADADADSWPAQSITNGLFRKAAKANL